MRWLFKLIKFIFLAFISIIVGLTGYFWYLIGLKKIGSFQTICFIIALGVFIFLNPVSGVCVSICAVLDIISLIAFLIKHK